MHGGEGARQCLTPAVAASSDLVKSGKDFNKENRMRLAALQEKNLQRRIKEEAAAKSKSGPRPRSASSVSSSRHRPTTNESKRNILSILHESDALSGAPTPEKDSLDSSAHRTPSSHTKR